MFEALQNRLQKIVTSLTGRGALSEADVDATLREVRLALLEADVHFKVTKTFIERVRAQAIGQDVLTHFSPGQQVVKIVHDELVRLLGGSSKDLRFADRPPTIVMLVGVHGAGKTTTAAKLARLLQRRGRYPLLVATDLRRPAAVTQLQVVGKDAGVEVFADSGASDPVAVAAAAVEYAARTGHDVVLIDCAGRQHVDDVLMAELTQMRDAIHPHDVLLVVDAMTGQDAVAMAERFRAALGVDGVVVTKLDGDARGGAVLSIVEVTGTPVLFVGTGEKLDGLQAFHPDRMASRILGMGDVLTLIERAQDAVDAEAAAVLEHKLRKAEFTLEDFRDQLRQVKKIGPLESLLEMLPGLGGRARGLAGSVDERSLRQVEAMIDSMTPQERRHPHVIDGSRRRRIARGSGTTIQDVNRLLRQFEEARKLFKRVGEMQRGKRGKLQFPLQ